MGYRDATSAEKERFLAAAEKARALCADAPAEFDAKKRRLIRRLSPEGQTNIGGLSENALHLTLKYFLEPNVDYHEVAYGRYFLDVCRGELAYEIQTRNFCSFRKKLAAVSAHRAVTVVHPLLRTKHVYWIDPEDGSVSGGKTSPKHEDIYHAFRELVYIRELVGRETLSFCFPVLDCDEYRLLCGWDAKRKRGSVRQSLLPRELYGFYEYDTAFAFASLLPPVGDDGLTVQELANRLGKDVRVASAFANVLLYLDILRKDGKIGRKIRYRYGENY